MKDRSYSEVISIGDSTVVIRQESRKHLLLAFIAAAFLLLSLFFMLIPYSGDDWAWGSAIGVTRLRSFFNNYNGRYISDLLALIMTRSVLLRSFLMAGGVAGIAYLIADRFAEKKDLFLYFFFAICVLFLLPTDVFRETLGWTSGAANYLFCVLPILLIHRVVDRDVAGAPVKGVVLPCVLCTCIGLFGSFLVEHVTVHGPILGVVLIVYSLIVKKKISIPYIAYFAGALVGSILMFLNPAYGLIGHDKTAIRSIFTETGFIGQFKLNQHLFFDLLILRAFLLDLIVFAAVLLFAVLKLKNGSLAKWRSTAVITLITVSSAFMVLCAIYRSFPGLSDLTGHGSETTNTVIYAFAVLQIISLLLLPFFAVDDLPEAFRLALPIVSAVILSAPLAFVDPIGPRCFLPVYLLFITYALGLTSQAVKLAPKPEVVTQAKKAAFCTLVILCLFISAVLGVRYSRIHSTYKQRVTALRQQTEKKAKVVYVIDYPDELKRYLWVPTPDKEHLQKRFIQYYGLSQDAKLEIVTYSQYKKLTAKKK